jgi:hypothetical protein
MIRSVLGALFLMGASVLGLSQAMAADAGPTTTCFEVLSAPQGFTTFAFVLVNKCTGNTWILQKVQSADAKGNPNGVVFRWRAINFDNTQGDALFAQ